MEKRHCHAHPSPEINGTFQEHFYINSKIIEKKLDRPLTKDDLFRFERFLDSRSVTDFFPEWMNKPLNKSKGETK